MYNNYSKIMTAVYLTGGILMAIFWFYWGFVDADATLLGIGSSDYKSVLGDNGEIVQKDIAKAEILSALAVIIIGLMPLFLSKVFKIRFSPVLISTYITFVFVAHFVGSVIDTYDRVDWYDDLTHTIFGAVGGLMAIYLFTSFNDYKQFKYRTMAIFVFFFPIAFGAVWEIYEFAADEILGLIMQRAEWVIDSGYSQYATADTVHDLWVTFIGATVVLIALGLHTKNPDKKFVVGYYVNNQ